MADDGIEPIEIVLSVPAQQVVESMQEISRAASQEIERAYSSACDAAERKLHELTQAQQVHQGVIETTGGKVAELAAKKLSASQAEQQALDDEISKLRQLQQVREQDVLAIDGKKAKVQAQIDISRAQTDQERLGISLVTTSRLIEINSLRDQQRALASVRDLSESSARFNSESLSDQTRRQQQLNSTIEQLKGKVAELATQRSTSSQAAQAGIDEEVAGLTRSISAYQMEVSRIEEKKARIEETAALAASTSEQEREEIKSTTDARIAGIMAVRDQVRAQQGVRSDPMADAADNRSQIDGNGRQRANEVEAVAQLSARVQELQAQRASASSVAQQEIDAEIAGLRRLIDQHTNVVARLDEKKARLEEAGRMATATSDQERAAIQSETDARLVSIRTEQELARARQATGTITSDTISKAETQIAALNRREQETVEVVASHRQRISELQQGRAEASTEQRAQIDDEVSGLQRLVASRESDIAEIAKKRVRLEEVISLARSGSEEEREGIRQATSARVAEIDAMSEQRGVQQGINSEQAEGNGLLSQMFTLFEGVGGVLLFFSQWKQLLQDNVDLLNKAVEAGSKLRDASGTQFDKGKAFFNAIGANDAASQASATAVMNDIAKTNNLTQDVVASTAAEMAPGLKAEGVGDINSDRFKQLVGNTAKYVNRGLDPRLAANYVSEQLRAKPDISPDDMNQQMSNLLATAGGSSSHANELLSVYEEDKQNFDAAGFDLNDVGKVFAQLQKTTSPYEVPRVARQYFHGLDRMVGMSRKQIGELANEMSDYSPLGRMQLAEQSKFLTPEQLLHQQERLRTGGVSGLDDVFNSAMKDGKIDIRAMADAISRLPEDQRKRAGLSIAGPRGDVAIGAVAGWQDQVLPTGTPLQAPDNADQTARVLKEQADAQSAAANPTDPFAAQFAAQVTDETTAVDRNGDNIKSFSERHPDFIRAMTLGAAHPATSAEIAAGRVLTRRLVDLARMRQQIASGKVKATPQQQAQLQSAINGVMGLLQQTDQQPDEYQALANGTYTRYADGQAITTNASDVLRTYDANPTQFLTNNLNTVAVSSFSGEVQDDRAAGPVLRSAENAQRAINGLPPVPPMPTPVMGPPAPTPAPAPAAPTTRPAATQPTSPPVSINYHVRQTNYGYSSDSLGSPAGFDTNFG